MARLPNSEGGGIGARLGLDLRALRSGAWAAVLAIAFCMEGATAQIVSPNTTGSASPSAFPKAPGGPTGPAARIDQAQPLYLTGDELVYDNNRNVVTARGNVEIYYNNYVLTADEVTYDQAANTLTAVGNVAVSDPNGNVTRSERVTLSDDFRDGFSQNLSVVARDNSRIEALRATRRNANVTEFERGKYTPCKVEPGKPPLWCVSAARIIHDQQAATISYQDAQFELFGVPLLYLPFFQHPDPSVKRRSGFLLPDFGQSERLGFQIEIPYFFALAPNYDFTFRPRVTSKEGILWQGDWRHRLRIGDVSGEYEIKLAGIDQNTDLESLGLTRSELGGDVRGSVQTRGKFSLASWWNFGWDITVESDDTFRRFFELDNILQTDRINQVWMRGISERNYLSIAGYQFGSLTLSPGTTAESRTQPIVDYYRVDHTPLIGGELNVNANAVSFTRTNGSLNQRESSYIQRVSADVTWRRRLTDQIGIEYTPFANVRGDAIEFADVVDPQTGEAINSQTVTRGVASAGVLAAYPWVAHTQAASHVISPIGQIIGRTAKTDQARLPDEDARSLVFGDINLFDINKFSGFDRIETGTRVNYGLQYTFQVNTGGHVRLLAGQSQHLAGENPYAQPGVDTDKAFQFSPVSGLQRSSSDYVFAAYLAPATIFQIVGQARFDSESFALRRADLIGQANYGPLFGQAIYSYSSFEPFQTVVDGNVISQLAGEQQELIGTLGLRLTDRWSVQGLQRYDIANGTKIQDQYVLRYADECFVLSATYTETKVTNAAFDLEPDRSVMVRFELKNIGQFGYRTSALEDPLGFNQPR